MSDLYPRPETLADDWMVAERPPSPLRIEQFRFWYFSGEEAESTVQMTWRDPDVGGVTKVFRQVVPLVKLALPSGFEGIEPPEVLPFGWNVIGVLENEFPGAYMQFKDEDIPPMNESFPRSLGALYTYKVEVSGGERSARSPVIYTRMRGINSPRGESAAAISDSEIRVRWRNNSQLASGFQVRSFEAANGDDERVITINGATKKEHVITGLSPDTRYIVTVRAWDFYGMSGESTAGEARTMPAPDAEPEDKTFSVPLTRQPIVQGNIPYLGRFPTSGNLPSGTLRKVSLHSAWPALFFVKPGRSTDECDDPEAVVVLAPGTSLTADEMTELYGAATPNLPVVFLACAQATPTLYEWIPIQITYRTN